MLVLVTGTRRCHIDSGLDAGSRTLPMDTKTLGGTPSVLRSSCRFKVAGTGRSEGIRHRVKKYCAISKAFAQRGFAVVDATNACRPFREDDQSHHGVDRSFAGRADWGDCSQRMCAPSHTSTEGRMNSRSCPRRPGLSLPTARDLPTARTLRLKEGRPCAGVVLVARRRISCVPQYLGKVVRPCLHVLPLAG